MRVHARTDAEKRKAHNDVARRHAAASRDRNPDFRIGELRRIFRDQGLCGPEIKAALADLGDVWSYSPQGLGAAINLTFEQRERLGIRSIQCCNRTPEQVAAYQREKKRVRDRAGAKKRRAKAKRERKFKGPANAARAAAVREFLSGRDKASAAFIGDQMRGHPAFRALDKDARRKAVHRAISDIGADTLKLHNECGFPTIFARLPA
jgi:hypothetical protein